MKKLAIIGASYFQNPLIEKAKEKGCETHVFAWECGDIGEATADHFYPISITEKDEILKKCRDIGIDGICSIGSDLANITVSYVAGAMGLTANSRETVAVSTNKHLMRDCFAKNGDPSPRSILVKEGDSVCVSDLRFPIIVKPVDRSGSRGITKLEEAAELDVALSNAFDKGFAGEAVVEEFIEGEEFSIEFVSWNGEHTFLALTKKFTTGAPGFVETGHLEPAQVSANTVENIKEVVSEALDHLGVEFGASHSEVLIDGDGQVWIVEIGSRMGGDCIGSDLVYLSTGIDFTGAVVDIALGIEPDLESKHDPGYSMIRFIFNQDDLDVLGVVKENHPELIVFESPIEDFDHDVTDSSSRFGFFILRSASFEDIEDYLPCTVQAV